jgi:hypothetical protein
VNTVDSTNSTVTTSVEYPIGMEAQAKAVRNAVTGAKLIETSTVPRVTLIVGGDGVQVNGLARSSSTNTTTATATAHAATTKTAPKPVAGLGCIN